MKKAALVLIICSLALNLSAQVGEYSLRKERTSEITKKYVSYTFSLIKVEKKQLSIPIYEEIKTETENFKQEKGIYDQLISDSTKYAAEYSTKLKKYEEINTIVENVQKFMSSSEKFDDKSDLLINAQKISDKYFEDVLIYADKEINSDKRRDFNSLKRDTNSLNTHLNRVVNYIRANNLMPANESKNSPTI